MAEVIEAVNETSDATRCGGAGDCQNGETCLTHHLWMDLSEQIRSFLAEISLGDLMQRQEVRAISENQDTRVPGRIDQEAVPLTLMGSSISVRCQLTQEFERPCRKNRLTEPLPRIMQPDSPLT